MKQLSAIQLQLLEYLADGKCHSGRDLGERLGVSRTAIWKQMSLLQSAGLQIKRMPQKGYQLSQAFIAINSQKIQDYLCNTPLSFPPTFHLFTLIDSTNRYLKELNDCGPFTVCIAEAQSHGRGRFGREWISPFGENIYLSLRREFDCCLSELSGLSLVISLAILASLKKSNNDESIAIAIKWPNDLLWNHKKLCGILIEIIAETNGRAHVIIGIGLNVNTDNFPEELWSSLRQCTGRYFDRNELIANMLLSIDQHLKQFLQHGFSYFQERWKAVDYLKDRFITVSQMSGIIHGYAKGVSDDGRLCLIDNEGETHYLSSGDTSISKQI